MHSFVSTSLYRAPSLKDYKYDFETGRFTDVQGRPISIAAVAEAIPRAAGIGEKTARRAIFLQSLIHSSSQEVGERSGILEQIHRWGDSASPESLDRLFSKDRLSEGRGNALAFFNSADGITYFIADNIPEGYTAKKWPGLLRLSW